MSSSQLLRRPSSPDSQVHSHWFSPLRNANPPPLVQVGPQSYTEIPSSSDHLVNICAQLPHPPVFLPEAHSCLVGPTLSLLLLLCSSKASWFWPLCPGWWQEASVLLQMESCAGALGLRSLSWVPPASPSLSRELTSPGCKHGHHHHHHQSHGTSQWRGSCRLVQTHLLSTGAHSHTAPICPKVSSLLPEATTPSACSLVGGAFPSQWPWRLLQLPFLSYPMSAQSENKLGSSPEHARVWPLLITPLAPMLSSANGIRVVASWWAFKVPHDEPLTSPKLISRSSRETPEASHL